MENLRSGLSISTHAGCSLQCSYCILDVLDFDTSKPQQIANVESIENKLFREGSDFLSMKPPLLVNNRTDPFLPQVAPATYEVLDMLARNKVETPVILITKLAPNFNLDSYSEKLNLMVFYTFSGLDRPIETRTASAALRFIDRFTSNVPFASRYHYFRPIISGLNDNEDSIRWVLNTVSSKFRASVVSGLRILPSIKQKLEAHGIMLGGYRMGHKTLFEDTLLRVWKLRDEIAPDYVVFRHTSCAIFAHLGKPDHLGWRTAKKLACDPKCSQRALCMNFSPFINDTLVDYIKRHTRAKFVLDGDTIIFDDPVEQELISSIKLNSGAKVKTKELIYSPSESEFLHA